MRGNFMEHDIYDSLRRTVATICERMTAYFMDFIEEIKRLMLKIIPLHSPSLYMMKTESLLSLRGVAEGIAEGTALTQDALGAMGRAMQQKLRPNYEDKCKIRWLDIPNKVMLGRIRRFR